mgnify:CR=1 FL=1
MKIIDKISDNKNLILFILGVIVTLLLLKQCNTISSLKDEVKYTEEKSNINLNNLKASRDSIRILKNVNGDNISQIRSFTLDLAEKDALLDDMVDKYKDALNLSRDLKYVNSLISTKLEIKDSLLANANVSKIDSNSAEINFLSSEDYGDGNSRLLTGSSIIKYDLNGFKVLKSSFELKQTLNLMAAIENVNGVDVVKVTTSYPGIDIKGVENINLINTRINKKSEKKSGWSIGIGLGYGVNLNNNQVISTGPSIGLACIYSPKWLRF